MIMKRWLAAAALCCVTPACNDSPCSDDGQLEAPAPQIDAVEVLQDRVPGDPWELVFVVRFGDADGDLEPGHAEVFLGSNAPTTLELNEIFRQSALAPTSTSGLLTLPLRFSDTVRDGTDVRMGLQLVDEAARRGNCYSMDLHFTVTPVSQMAREAGRVVARVWGAVGRFFDGG